MAEWRRLVAMCDAKAQECVADPAAAALEGLEPQYEASPSDFVTYGGRGERQARNDYAGWLRAAAGLLLDRELWNYRIYEAMGGQAYIALLSFNGGDDHCLNKNRMDQACLHTKSS